MFIRKVSNFLTEKEGVIMKKFLGFLCVFLSLIITVPVYGYKPGSEYSEDPVDILISGNLKFQTDIFASGHEAGATIIGSGVSPLTTAHLAFGLVRFANGSPNNHPLPDGVKGKVVTFELIADPSYIIGVDAPMTKTGWESITFNSAGDSITLLWVDDTSGWIIIANDGCRIVR